MREPVTIDTATEINILDSDKQYQDACKKFLEDLRSKKDVKVHPLFGSLIKDNLNRKCFLFNLPIVRGLNFDADDVVGKFFPMIVVDNIQGIDLTMSYNRVTHMEFQVLEVIRTDNVFFVKCLIPVVNLILRDKDC